MKLVDYGHVTNFLVPPDITRSILNYIEKHVHDTIVIEDSDDSFLFLPTAYIEEFIVDLQEESQNFIWEVDNCYTKTSKRVTQHCTLRCYMNKHIFLLWLQYDDSMFRIIHINYSDNGFIFFLQDSTVSGADGR
jgi:hypothetical protein